MMNQELTDPRILVLVSGSGSNLQALIEATRERDYPGQIVAVGSNRPDVLALERAKRAGIETFTVDHQKFGSRDEFDTALKAEIERHSPDVVVLAGFMRILTPGFVNAFRGRMLNIHPSLLPKYTGLNTHQRALDAGDQRHGVSIHFVTEDLDGGPVIAQAEVAVAADDDAQSLAARVQQQEHVLYPIVLRWFCEGRVQLDGEHATFDGTPLTQPLVLPAEEA